MTLIFVGTPGYMTIEDARFSDALYMAVITISTVGYAEVVPLTETERRFTPTLIFGGFVRGGFVWDAAPVRSRHHPR